MRLGEATEGSGQGASGADGAPDRQPPRWRRKDLLGLEDLTRAELEAVLDAAEALREVAERTVKQVPTLRGRTLARLFFETGPGVAAAGSATVWDLAARRLSADSVEVPVGPAVGSDGGASALADELEGLAADLLLVRHPHPGVPLRLARRLRSGVVNAGDGAHEDPAAALSLAATLRRHRGSLDGARVALLGDFRHSGVARSLAHLLGKMGAEGVVGGLHALVPPGVEALGLHHAPTPDEAVEGADAVVVLPPAAAVRDGRTYPSAAEYLRIAGLTAARLARAAEDAVVLHPGPMGRGLDIAPDVAGGPASLVALQGADALAVRMAILELLATRVPRPGEAGAAAATTPGQDPPGSEPGSAVSGGRRDGDEERQPG